MTFTKKFSGDEGQQFVSGPMPTILHDKGAVVFASAQWKAVVFDDELRHLTTEFINQADVDGASIVQHGIDNVLRKCAVPFEPSYGYVVRHDLGQQAPDTADVMFWHYGDSTRCDDLEQRWWKRHREEAQKTRDEGQN